MLLPVLTNNLLLIRLDPVTRIEILQRNHRLVQLVIGPLVPQFVYVLFADRLRFAAIRVILRSILTPIGLLRSFLECLL